MNKEELNKKEHHMLLKQEEVKQKTHEKEVLVSKKLDDNKEKHLLFGEKMETKQHNEEKSLKDVFDNCLPHEKLKIEHLTEQERLEIMLSLCGNKKDLKEVLTCIDGLIIDIPKLVQSEVRVRKLK